MQRGGISLLLFAGVATIAVVVVVFAMAGINKTTTPSPTPPADIRTQQLMEQSESDEAVSIEQDLEATEFTGLDTELTDIDKEVNQ